MLTLAAFLLEKIGGDTMDDVRMNLDAYGARIAGPIEMPVAGGQATRTAGHVAGIPGARSEADAAAVPIHGLAGTDEAGSGGDD